MKNKISIISYIILIISSIIVLLTYYINLTFANVTFEQLLYSLTTSTGTGASMIIDGVKYIVPKVLVFLLFLIVVDFIWRKLIKQRFCLKISFKKKDINISLTKLSGKEKIILSILVLIISLFYLAYKIGFIQYISFSNWSTFIEDNYVDPKDVSITAPEDKKNLIFIYVESLESTLISGENGGRVTESVIPYLESLALEYTSFSNNDDVLGGGYVPYGTGWTIAGMVASTSGVPLKLPLTDLNAYSGYGTFLPGAYTLGDVLEDNGYSNYLMIGSDASFGGRRDYFESHGNYTIYDYYYAKEEGWIDEDYYVWWGYEDRKLYEFAKDELTEIAANDEPFNFTLLTVDTHATDGYLDSECENPFDEQYLNTYNCADELLEDFIGWIQEQDFYEDTVIVIVGDHTSMQGNMWDFFDYPIYRDKTIYNVFINSDLEAKQTNNRYFTALDFYPTTLAALGFEIEGDKLGLGVNLYSDENTLLEDNSIDILNEEFAKTSTFYNDYLLENMKKVS